MSRVGTEIARHRRWLTGLLAGALGSTVFAVALTYWRSVTRWEKPLPVPQTLPTNVHQQLSGYTFTHSEEDRRIFTVHASRTVAFKQGGTTLLEDVYVEVFGRSGDRRDLLRTGSCDYNPQTGDLFSHGAVEFELNAGASVPPERAQKGRRPIFLETSKVVFRQQGSVVLTDQPVRFRIGPGSGSGWGVTYATKDGWVEVKKNVIAELELRGAQPQPPVRLSASRLRYAPSRGHRGEVRLSGPIEITQGNRRVVADRGTIYLDAQNRITETLLEGDVRAFDSSGGGILEGSAQRVRAEFDPEGSELRTLLGEGNVRIRSGHRDSVNRLEAERLEMSFTGPHPQPVEGSGSGNVRLTLESAPPQRTGALRQSAAGTFSAAAQKTLTAAQLRVSFRPGGRSLREAQTIGPGKLLLVSPNPEMGERLITAGFFLMGFDSRSRLETLRGFSGTEIISRPRVHAPPGSVAQVTSSERLEAAFDPTSQTLQMVEQAGAFQFREGDRQASAERGCYRSQTEVLRLLGQPQIWDANTRTRAERILLDLRADTAEALGKVQSTHFESASEAEAKPARPPSPDSDDPTNVLADRMLAERRSQYVHYEGHVRAWHGYDVVESSSLEVYRTERRVRSRSRVITSYLQPASPVSVSPGSPVSKESRPVTICADSLDYFDQERKATYRGNVELKAQNTRLVADRMDVYFSPQASAGASEVERAVADGRVTVVQPTRRASGEHVEYYAGPGKIFLTGGPPALYDAEKGFITGQRLTFFIHDDRILVDGGDRSPSLSKRRIAQ